MMTMCKNDDKLPHQKSSFIASKGVGLFLDVWPSRKYLKRLLQNNYMLVLRFIIP